MSELLILGLTALLLAYAGRKLGKRKENNDKIYQQKINKKDGNA